MLLLLVMLLLLMLLQSHHPLSLSFFFDGHRFGLLLIVVFVSPEPVPGVVGVNVLDQIRVALKLALVADPADPHEKEGLDHRRLVGQLEMGPKLLLRLANVISTLLAQLAAVGP